MKLEEKNKAIKLREKGFSMGEISQAVGVSKSTVSLWVKDLKLSNKAKKIIASKLTKGQEMSIKTHHEITRQKEKIAKDYALDLVKKIKIDKNMAKLVCSLLYASEGSKGPRSVLSFTNSDPNMIVLFLKMLRDGFDIDEKKFSICVHLHDYHNEEKQLNFWSKTARISRDHFMRPYRKPHTGVNKKEGYEGCVRINYYDISLRRKIIAIADQFIKNTGL